MCSLNLPGSQMVFMSLFCGSGGKPAPSREPHFFAPSRLCG